MPVYIVTPLIEDSSKLNNAVDKHIKDAAHRHKLQADRGWLIKYEGTSMELSNLLEITGQDQGVSSPVGSAIVVPVSGYYGRGPTEMWEWLKTRLEQ